MKTSMQFERAIFHNQSPSIVDYLETRYASVFVPDASQSWVDVCLFNSPGLTQHRDASNPQNQRLADARLHNSACEDQTGLWTTRLDHAQPVVQLVKRSKESDRLFFIRQKNTRSRLSITRSLFECLLVNCNVFPQLLDFVPCFGMSNCELEIGMPHTRFRALNLGHGLTGGFECAYGLQLAELNHRGDRTRPWSVRHFAVYQQYDHSSQCSTWIFIALTKTCETRLERYLRGVEDEVSLNPFEIHILLLDTATANWRCYLGWLNGETGDRTTRIVVASVAADALVPIVDINERQRLKQLEDDLVDLQLILDSTMNVVHSMISAYMEFSRAQCERVPEKVEDYANKDIVARALLAKQQELALLKEKAKAISAKVTSTTELVSILLSVSNGHSLQTLAEESKKDNAAMMTLSERAFADAVAVKVLTIVTLIYLPTTVVTNFFSTEFVSQRTGNGGLEVTPDWWILVAVALPLTVLTLYIWWIWVEKQAFGRSPIWLRLILAPVQRFQINVVREKDGLPRQRARCSTSELEGN